MRTATDYLTGIRVVLTTFLIDLGSGMVNWYLYTPKKPYNFMKYHLFSCRVRPSPAGRFRLYSYVFQGVGPVGCSVTGLNTAPLELKKIKLESGIRKCLSEGSRARVDQAPFPTPGQSGIV